MSVFLVALAVVLALLIIRRAPIVRRSLRDMHRSTASLRVAELEIESARLRQKNALLQCQLASVSSALHDARENAVRVERAYMRASRRDPAT